MIKDLIFSFLSFPERNFFSPYTATHAFMGPAQHQHQCIMVLQRNIQATVNFAGIMRLLKYLKCHSSQPAHISLFFSIGKSIDTVTEEMTKLAFKPPPFSEVQCQCPSVIVVFV